jgi:putative transposase
MRWLARQTLPSPFMAVYVQLLYHVVIATAHHHNTLDQKRREELYRFIWGCVKERKCALLRIGGVDNHFHMLLAVHPAVAMGEVVAVVKRTSAEWIKANRIFPRFQGWDAGYTALTCAWEEKDMLVDAIKHQEEHHQEVTFRDEFEELMERAGLQIAADDRAWLDDAEEQPDAIIKGNLYDGALAKEDVDESADD